MAVQDLSNSGTIDPSQIQSECLSTTSHMESIADSTNGIAKLLKDLNPIKQQDLIVLQRLRDVIIR